MDKVNLFEQQARMDASTSKAINEMFERIKSQQKRNKLFGFKDSTFECQCENSGECDSCVASRSDEHFDRKRDGEMK